MDHGGVACAHDIGNVLDRLLLDPSIGCGVHHELGWLGSSCQGLFAFPQGRPFSRWCSDNVLIGTRHGSHGGVLLGTRRNLEALVPRIFSLKGCFSTWVNSRVAYDSTLFLTGPKNLTLRNDGGTAAPEALVGLESFPAWCCLRQRTRARVPLPSSLRRSPTSTGGEACDSLPLTESSCHVRVP